MSDRFAATQARKVVSRASAEELGKVSHLLVDTEHRCVTSVVVGNGRNARLVDWKSISGFGSDAIMVADEACLRDPGDEREKAGSRGKLELLGKRALSDLGNELGEIDDVIFDTGSGALEAIVVADHEEPADSLLGAGSYAVVLRAGGGEPADA